MTMIVWGGFGGTFTHETSLASGARYDPAADGWVPTAASAAPTARWGHRAVWTGSRMLVWGGSTYSRLGGQYDPAGNAWSYTTTLDAPLGRTDHTAVWTGSRMIVWGGTNGSPLATGGLFAP
jgi:N-acetylneuraminic acid mutarotase